VPPISRPEDSSSLPFPPSVFPGGSHVLGNLLSLAGRRSPVSQFSFPQVEFLVNVVPFSCSRRPTFILKPLIGPPLSMTRLQTFSSMSYPALFFLQGVLG